MAHTIRRKSFKNLRKTAFGNSTESKNLLKLSPRIWIVTAVLLLCIVVGFYLFNTKKIDYVIPIAPITMYNQDILHYPRVYHGGVALVSTILLYWGEKVNFDNSEQMKGIRQMFDDDFGPKVDIIEEYFDQHGYTFTAAFLPAIDDLKKYVNPKSRTPLFFNIGFNLETPGLVDYHLLVGIKEKSRKIVFQDFILGKNYEIDFDEFEKLWAAHPYGKFRNRYFVIQPKDLQERLANMPQKMQSFVYPSMQTIQALEPILSDYLWGMSTMKDTSIERFTHAIMNPQFSLLHPAYQVTIYSRLADWQIKTNHLQDAAVSLQKAHELNHDLSRPFNGWPQVYRVGRISWPDEVSGSYYRIVGDIKKATKHEQQAKEIRDASRKSIGLPSCEPECYRFVR